MLSITELRKYKLGDNVLFDHILTLLIAIIFSLYTKIPLVITIIVFLVLGELLHYIFNIPSNTIKYFNIYK